MSVRAIFAVTLLSLALPAAAQDARLSGTGGDAGCAADAAADPDPVRNGKRPESHRPAIPRGAGADADAARPPRWHSFLPGMFR